jgi:hypothetical protein
MLNVTERKWQLRRVRLNSGGYTSAGYYYGHGAPLYEAIHEGDLTEGAWITLRAASREKAKDHIRQNFEPDAVFYR